MRTNIDIDDELMRKVLAVTGLKTKKAAVDEALRLLLRLREQEKLKDLFGLAPDWEGDLDQLRRDRFPEWSS
jgi:Arc/MetJ family transcription regulator